MSVHAESQATSVPQLAQARAEGRKLVMLTCYDASFARVLDDAGVDLILIGDSLGMVVQPVVAELLPGGQGYRVRFLPPWTDFPGDDDLAAARRMNAWIEDEVRQHEGRAH